MVIAYLICTPEAGCCSLSSLIFAQMNSVTGTFLRILYLWNRATGETIQYIVQKRGKFSLIRPWGSDPRKILEGEPSGDSEGVAKAPGRDTSPDSLRLHLNPGALRLQTNGERYFQRALVHGRCRTDGLVRLGLDRDCGRVLNRVLRGLAPDPGLGGRRLHVDLVSRDNRDTDCKRSRSENCTDTRQHRQGSTHH